MAYITPLPLVMMFGLAAPVKVATETDAVVGLPTAEVTLETTVVRGLSVWTTVEDAELTGPVTAEAGGGTTDKLTVAPHCSKGVPFGQHPALVQ